METPGRIRRQALQSEGLQPSSSTPKMPPHRPRASDFDAPAWGRAERPLPPIHHQRRPSPTYEPPSPHYTPDSPQSHPQSPLKQQRRLTPEESLERYHQDHRSNRYNQPQSTKNSYSDGYRQGGRDDFFEKRRTEREDVTIEFWPRSPSRPYGEEKKRHHSSHKEERHERSKDKKKKSRHEKSDRKSKKHDHSDDSQSDRSEQRHHHKLRKKHKSPKRQKSHKHGSEEENSNSDDEVKERGRGENPRSNPIEEEDLWMEKEVVPAVETSTNNPRKDSLSGPLRPTTVDAPESNDEEDAGEVGPMPYNHVTGKAMDPKEFGRALRPGEGSAMAAFIEAGERIPRRGEIGLTGVEIEKFENVGYVMSGSRHRRMNAVRIRKENQVISAEEKRGILKMQAEEKAKREGQIISSFRELVDTKLQETG